MTHTTRRRCHISARSIYYTARPPGATQGSLSLCHYVFSGDFNEARLHKVGKKCKCTPRDRCILLHMSRHLLHKIIRVKILLQNRFCTKCVNRHYRDFCLRQPVAPQTARVIA